MDRLLQFLLKTFIRRGTFRVTTSRGTVLTFGDGTGQPVSVRFASRAAEWGILLDPELKFGETYMNGTFVVEQGSIADVLAIMLGQNSDVPHWARPQGLLRYLDRRLQQFNPRRRARHNVAHHYDLDGRLYSLFLDADRQYSCGYFESPEQSLDDAQLAKKRHLAAKLLLGRDRHERDLRVLDIGCGWGGLGLVSRRGRRRRRDRRHAVAGAARHRQRARRGKRPQPSAPASTCRTIATSRARSTASSRSACSNMSASTITTRSSARARNCFADDGVMVLHSIGRSEGPSVTNPWIAKYIFPGGYIPSLSEVLPRIEKSGLLITDIEILRLHYAETLKAWRERFLAHREEVERIYDRRFVRMWEFYLASSEMSFREQNLMVFQIQLTKRQDVVPMTRDYIGREERRLRGAEGERHPPLRLAGE